MIFAGATDTAEISIATINVNYTRIPHTRGAFVDSHSISLAECLGAPWRYTDSAALSMQKDPNRLRARTIEKSSHCSQLSFAPATGIRSTGFFTHDGNRSFRRCSVFVVDFPPRRSVMRVVTSMVA